MSTVTKEGRFAPMCQLKKIRTINQLGREVIRSSVASKRPPDKRLPEVRDT